MRLLIIVAMLTSTSLFAACPDLTSSTTTCRSTTGQTPGNTNQVITQKTVDGITTYTITYTSHQSQEEVVTSYIADGKSRRETQVDPDSGISLLTATTVTCAGNAVNGHVTAFIDGQFLGVLDLTVSKSGNTITNAIEGAMFGRDVEDVVICD